MSFKINGLSAFQFRRFASKTDAELASLGVKRSIADSDNGYPCRVSLQDAKKGETVFLINYQHHAVDSPYRASGPIFVRESATDSFTAVNDIPDQLRKRLLSLRGYDSNGFMRHADVVDGSHGEDMLKKFFSDDEIEYVQVHNARYGCFLCQVDRG